MHCRVKKIEKNLWKRIETKKETLKNQGFQSGSGGIRTHVPLRTTAFRVFQSDGFPVFFGACLC